MKRRRRRRRLRKRKPNLLLPTKVAPLPIKLMAMPLLKRRKSATRRRTRRLVLPLKMRRLVLPLKMGRQNDDRDLVRPTHPHERQTDRLTDNFSCKDDL